MSHDLSDPLLCLEDFTPEEVAAMMRAVFVLFEKWGVSDTEARVLLGQPDPATFLAWRAGDTSAVSVTGETTRRLGVILSIHKHLRMIFASSERVYTWISAPNSEFGGRSALAFILDGTLVELMLVRDYLAAQK